MKNNKLQKLELTWIGKGEEPKLEPRILIEQPEYSYWEGKEKGKPAPWSTKNQQTPKISVIQKSTQISDSDNCNMLIHGDNLLALKALEQDYAGSIKCIYIDPPFNTGAAFDNYDDGVEHSIWLDLMYQRLKILHVLLKKEGSIFIHLDDNEVDYCKVIMDDVFGRSNFINRITVDARSSSPFSTVNPCVFKSSEYILWYAKNKQAWESRSIRIPSIRDTAYNKFILNRNQQESDWIFIPLKQAFLEFYNNERLNAINSFIENVYNSCKGFKKATVEAWILENFELSLLFNIKTVSNYLTTKLKIDNYQEFYSAVYLYILEKCSFNYSENDIDEFVFNNSDAVCRETEISDSGAGQETVDLKYKSLESTNTIFKLVRDNGLDTIYIINGKQISFYSKNVELLEGKLTATKLLTNVWTDISWEGIAKEGSVKFKKGKKPEKLLKRCLELTTNKGDLVFDSFLGSGTTAAVAHKMGRKYIGIELGEQAKTHCFKRLKSIVDNEQSGISKLVNWQGGGGFKFYTLAPSLLQKDKYGNWIIENKYNSSMLAAAMAKQEGFSYQPHESLYWKQGYSSEQDFIYTTTQFMTVESLDQIYEEMKPGESLLICCKSFQKECKGKYGNITIKKIPQMLLGRCEFGKEDYSLNIVNMPIDDTEHNIEQDKDISIQEINDNTNKNSNSQPTLFD